MRLSTIFNLAAAVFFVAACDSCFGPSTEVQHIRNVRRMQPESSDAASGPKRPLEWGQLNFLHTASPHQILPGSKINFSQTDTHGWLEGHLKERNYGADWGDFVSFSRHMKHKAGNLGVDLLLVDTGDLHDGAGLSDAALPNGVVSNPIFDEIDYDVLTIGNHELYVSDIAYEHFYNFSKVWGDRYVNSNVQIFNPRTSQYEYIGSKYRYFETQQGLRIMTFGVLFDFTGNSNASKVMKAATMIQQPWFLEAVNFNKPIDLFLLVGHNPIRTTVSSSTFGLLHETIRRMRPDVPIQAFGGHTHIRDFQVYDSMSTGLESGRYCETLGWLSMSGIKSKTFRGNAKPRGVANPTRKALSNSTSGIVYSRRYLDWNRLTFAYHATSSQDKTFDYHSGLRVTQEIADARKKLNLTSLYGCAPATYCASCKPFGAEGNIFSLVPIALGAEVVNTSRSTIPRYVIVNTGSIRFDLVKGPFTYDDSFIVSPFEDAFQYIPNVPYNIAKNVLNSLNGAALQDKRDNHFGYMQVPESEGCLDPTLSFISGSSRSRDLKPRGIIRRQTETNTPGYTTTDDFGTDGDDTVHSKIPYYAQPNYVQGNASFPTDGTTPATVDVVFLDYFASTVVSILNKLGGKYTTGDVTYYVDKSFTTQDYLPAYATSHWQANVPNCPVGQGVGSTD